MAFSPASVYDIKVITRTSSDIVLFTDTELRIVFSAKVTDTIQVSSDGGYIIVFTDSGEFKINVKPLDTVITPSATVSFTPSSPLLNVGSSNYARLIDNRFAYLASNVFQGCCGKAPTYVGSLVVAYPDLAALLASAPGSTGVIYTTEDTNLTYWWDGSAFVLMSGVQYYANFAAFPLAGEERVLYYDIAGEEMYVWVVSAYVSLCCDATQVVYTANQVAHGFSVGEVLYLSGDNTFALAQADNIATSYVAGVVTEVIDVDNFKYCTHGTVTTGVPAQTGGTVMYLSETTPGALTSTAPTSPDIVRPVMVVVDNGNQAIIMLSLVDSGAGSGTVTSVDLAMPPAFTVSGNPITTSGTITVAGAGVATQYVRGDGTLANFPNTLGGGASVSYYLNGSINQGTFGGVTYYEMNKTPIFGPGTNFSIAANGYIASFITDANDPSQLLIPAGNWNFEMYFSASSGGGSPNFYIELYKYDGVSFTLIASSSANPEDITGGTSTDLYVTAISVPSTVLTLTDRLAVRVYVNNSGRTITLHTEDNNLCQVITTFTTGITALNGLTEQIQTFATGTTGTDFGITSSAGVHTFNLPVASGTNTGKLSSTDWSTFNNKVTSVGATAPITSSGGATPNISTSMNTDRMIGRTTVGVGVMEEIQVSTGLSLSAGALSIPYGVITPTTTNAREDDYSPTGWPGTNDVVKVIRITPNNTNNIVSIGGLTNGTAGRIVTIVNDATDQLLILDHESPTSTATNRFKMQLQMSVFIMPGRDMTFLYTGTRWSQMNPGQYAQLDLVDNMTSGNQTRGTANASTLFFHQGVGTGSGMRADAVGNFDLGGINADTGTTSTGNTVGAISIRNGGAGNALNVNGQFPMVYLAAVGSLAAPTSLQDYTANVALEGTSAGWSGLGYIWKMPTFATTYAGVWEIDVTNTAGTLAVNVVTAVATTTKQYLGIFNHGNNGNATFFSSTDGITYTAAYKFVRSTGNFAGYPKYRIAKTVGTTSRTWDIYMAGVSLNQKR
jgi:hypothetical protein